MVPEVPPELSALPFGQAAATYDRIRPGHRDELVDAVVAHTFRLGRASRFSAGGRRRHGIATVALGGPGGAPGPRRRRPATGRTIALFWKDERIEDRAVVTLIKVSRSGAFPAGGSDSRGSRPPRDLCSFTPMHPHRAS